MQCHEIALHFDTKQMVKSKLNSDLILFGFFFSFVCLFRGQKNKAKIKCKQNYEFAFIGIHLHWHSFTLDYHCAWGHNKYQNNHCIVFVFEIIFNLLRKNVYIFH